MTTVERLQHTCARLMSDVGDASIRALGAEFLDAYRALAPEHRAAFFSHLVTEYGIDTDRMIAAYTAWESSGDDPAVAARAEIDLVDAAEPRRQTLFRRINHAPGATFALTALRSDLRALLPSHPGLRALDHDLHHLLSSWFNRGFLRMSEVTWDAPGELLDHLIRYEQVHPMAGLDELRRRLQPNDRRMYAFFHPATGNRPLIFVEVALTRGVPTEIGPILADGPALDPRDADTAVLYSISNALDGLAGVSFGNLLIKQVIEEVSAALPHLSTFVTLSPMPGFRAWLDSCEDPDTVELRAGLRSVADGADPEPLADRMRAAAARYICFERDAADRPLDPVARFHLSNGALAHRVHWPADSSARAWSQSYGSMINYLYEPAEVERRHEEYVRHHTVARSPEIAGPVGVQFSPAQP